MTVAIYRCAYESSLCSGKIKQTTFTLDRVDRFLNTTGQRELLRSEEVRGSDVHENIQVWTSWLELELVRGRKADELVRAVVHSLPW